MVTTELNKEKEREKLFEVQESKYKQMNKLQEEVIDDLYKLLKRSVNDLCLSFIAEAQSNLEYLENPISMFDQTFKMPKNGEVLEAIEFPNDLDNTQLLHVINYPEMSPPKRPTSSAEIDFSPTKHMLPQLELDINSDI